MIPAIEVVDYHYVAWTIGALQVAADNAIHGAWVHGPPLADWRTLDLAAGRRHRRASTATWRPTGSGAAVLGHPLHGDGVDRRRAAPVRTAGCAPATW